MKKTNILYWTLTGLFAFVMFGSAIPDVMVDPMAVDGFAQIGLPKSLVPFLGVAKMLGVVALFLPKMPRLKEWAYAGLMIDLIGATYLMAAARIPFQNWAPVFAFIALGFGSYVFYHKRRRERARRAEAVYANNFSFAQV